LQTVNWSSDVKRATKDWDPFFTAYSTFATSNKVFCSLVHRFFGAESVLPQDCTLSCSRQAIWDVDFPFLTKYICSIIVVMKHWVTHPYHKVDTKVLAQIEEFTMSIWSSVRMKELAMELRYLIPTD
jgi:hypothetical protein